MIGALERHEEGLYIGVLYTYIICARTKRSVQAFGPILAMRARIGDTEHAIGPRRTDADLRLCVECNCRVDVLFIVSMSVNGHIFGCILPNAASTYGNTP